MCDVCANFGPDLPFHMTQAYTDGLRKGTHTEKQMLAVDEDWGRKCRP